jgi:hypothetical protein
VITRLLPLTISWPSNSSATLGARHCEADVLNSLGELSSRTAETLQARDYHSQALAIARDLDAPLEEARALEGIGHSHLRDGHIGEGIAHLKQALAIYQRIGTPRAWPVQETLQQHAPNPASPPSKQQQARHHALACQARWPSATRRRHSMIR